MINVIFYDKVVEEGIKFVVIVAKYKGQWVYCKKKSASTYEVPGGKREVGEDIIDAAKRELYEETGAKEFQLTPICEYSLEGMENGKEIEKEWHGMLYYGNIISFGMMPEYEMEEVRFFDEIPENLTYPIAHPMLVKKVEEYISISN